MVTNINLIFTTPCQLYWSECLDLKTNSLYYYLTKTLKSENKDVHIRTIIYKLLPVPLVFCRKKINYITRNNS